MLKKFIFFIQKSRLELINPLGFQTILIKGIVLRVLRVAFVSAATKENSNHKCYNYKMKQANFIISQLTGSPWLKKLEQIASYKKLLALLPPRYQSAVRFMYNKNDTLFFVLEHPSFKQEFNYKKTMIKGLLKALVKQDKSCECIDAEELKFFITNKMP
ncbi:MAG: hypothetical protein LBS73_05085, partial [Campylobacteraceae bacterium]|nr:hypothetical protein [Campylobacteraceae bacterium]